MPIALDENITVTGETLTATTMWAKQIVIRMNVGEDGTAIAELVPMTADGKKVERDAKGASLVDTVNCPNILGFIESGNCPSLSLTMGNLIESIKEIKVENARLEALEDAAA